MKSEDMTPIHVVIGERQDDDDVLNDAADFAAALITWQMNFTCHIPDGSETVEFTITDVGTLRGCPAYAGINCNILTSSSVNTSFSVTITTSTGSSEHLMMLIRLGSCCPNSINSSWQYSLAYQSLRRTQS